MIPQILEKWHVVKRDVGVFWAFRIDDDSCAGCYASGFGIGYCNQGFAFVAQDIITSVEPSIARQGVAYEIAACKRSIFGLKQKVEMCVVADGCPLK